MVLVMKKISSSVFLVIFICLLLFGFAFSGMNALVTGENYVTAGDCNLQLSFLPPIINPRGLPIIPYGECL